jgi:hypothetical protein
MRTGTLTVTGVEGARSVQPEQGDLIVSPGIVVVVTFDFTPSVPETTITYGELRDADGRSTTVSLSGVRNVISCPHPPVGITTHCTAMIEADPHTLAGARLALAPLAIDPRFDDMAVADLAITRREVKAWEGRKEPLAVPAPAVAGMS